MALLKSACTVPDDELLFPEIVELNVGGQVYITRYSTIISFPDSLLAEMFTCKSNKGLARDTKGRFFVDRDGFLFRYVLDYMRDRQLQLPEHFPERARLQREAEFYKLPELAKMLATRFARHTLGNEGCQSDPEDFPSKTNISHNLDPLNAAAAPCTNLVVEGGGCSHRFGFITIGYEGSYTMGQDSQTGGKFRHAERIMVCGKTSLVKEVFGDTLSESQDSDCPPDNYTSRSYLKFTCLEQAFDKLAQADFTLVACNSTGNCSFAHDQADDKIWTSHTEYVFHCK
ncbi:BTB/POZ domain-containing protein KCTD12-like [Conger conger]|uniref:BTB/POZ domain-containing protein KCTD12-like n=1 Tax=Conger conger TaxID=82655 RepID=UPI002A5A0A90|nr:BTB/POZ domain-containing protein KCTD12-like [Conger conger]